VCVCVKTSQQYLLMPVHSVESQEYYTGAIITDPVKGVESQSLPLCEGMESPEDYSEPSSLTL